MSLNAAIVQPGMVSPSFNQCRQLKIDQNHRPNSCSSESGTSTPSDGYDVHGNIRKEFVVARALWSSHGLKAPVERRAYPSLSKSCLLRSSDRMVTGKIDSLTKPAVCASPLQTDGQPQTTNVIHSANLSEFFPGLGYERAIGQQGCKKVSIIFSRQTADTSFSVDLTPRRAPAHSRESPDFDLIHRIVALEHLFSSRIGLG
ncbi:hypothetical protein C8J56DRAFT_890717 [Mycena floridula]|nr:hypothetical protein C8J56DRAFT_890717 [Mycena floridula]